MKYLLGIINYMISHFDHSPGFLTLSKNDQAGKVRIAHQRRTTN